MLALSASPYTTRACARKQHTAAHETPYQVQVVWIYLNDIVIFLKLGRHFVHQILRWRFSIERHRLRKCGRWVGGGR